MVLRGGRAFPVTSVNIASLAVTTGTEGRTKVRAREFVSTAPAREARGKTTAENFHSESIVSDATMTHRVTSEESGSPCRTTSRYCCYIGEAGRSCGAAAHVSEVNTVHIPRYVHSVSTMRALCEV